MKYNDLINELLNLLDENDDIKKIKNLKVRLFKNNSLQDDLNTYHLTKSIEIKKKLFENSDYLEYLNIENNLNFLIHDIKNKFNVLNDRKCSSESN